jgi:hypothetical protein
MASELQEVTAAERTAMQWRQEQEVQVYHLLSMSRGCGIPCSCRATGQLLLRLLEAMALDSMQLRLEEWSHQMIYMWVAESSPGAFSSRVRRGGVLFEEEHIKSKLYE